MVAHRNVHIFNKAPQIRYFNNTRFTRAPHCHCNNSSFSIWSNPMFLMSLTSSLGGLFNGITSSISSIIDSKASKNAEAAEEAKKKAAEEQKQTEKNLKAFYKDYEWIYQDGEYWGRNKNDGSMIHGKTFADIKTQIENLKAKNNEKTTPEAKTKTTPEGTVPGNKTPTQGNEYSIEENKSNRTTVKTIQFGGPWHYAQYYKDKNGEQIKTGSADFNKIVQQLKTDMGSVEGNKGLRTLPTTITINGNTYTLMDEDARNALGLKGKGGGANITYSVISSSSTYSVYKTDAEGKKTLVQSGIETKEAAEALKKQKEEAEKAE